MPKFRVVAIPTEVAKQVRCTMKAPGYEFPAYTSLATGHGPCRHCLHTFQVGQEERTLFTFDPFSGHEKVPLPGPVYVHSTECQRYPEDGGYPDELREYPTVLVAYARGQEVLAQIHVTDGSQEGAIEQLLERPDVDYIHVRDREAGCYDFRIERVNGNAQPQCARERHKC